MDEHSFSEPGEQKTPAPSNFDPVNVPFHYNQGPIEVIDVIMDLELDNAEGNVAKYIMRHRYKNGRQDVEKAKRYLELIKINYDKWYGDKNRLGIREVVSNRKEKAVEYSILMKLDICEASILKDIVMHSYSPKKQKLIDRALEFIDKMLSNYNKWYERK